ncbi:DciA family protein [Streptomyces decoyicus]|uniref:DciA family protein n=1 Tax=Streptomyces decoyicus TaxID=249567 RepID=UPI00365DDD07
MTSNAHSHEQPTGPDLARVALRAAQEAARKNGGRTESRSPRRRSPQTRHADGRDPKSFDSVVKALITERGWEASAAGAGAVKLWPSIAGKDLAAQVVAIGFRSETHELKVHCDSPAWCTQLRLERGKLLQRFREALGADAVHDIVLSRPDRGAAPAPMPTTDRTPHLPSEEPLTTGQNPSAGYRRARAANEETRESLSAAKAASQRPPSALREPVEAFARELARTATSPPTGPSTHAQALARARRERAARATADTSNRTNRKGAPRA